MKAGEIIRIVIFGFVGSILMFFVQPWMYDNRIIPIKDVSVGDWLSDHYSPGAWVVFGVSIIATVIWYVLAANAKVLTASETDRWRVIWFVLLLLPLISIGLGISVFNNSNDALVSLTGFYIIDAILILYWLPTGTSSPSLLMYIPPGARLLRRIVGG
ncbi:MAG: hypothetical protein HEQ35_21400 [Gloeotrichia echinulata IR180]|jgi:hypothetical protein|nr:hypothetical protein [Gloeotrichia echinulata DEX184]